VRIRSSVTSRRRDADDELGSNGFLRQSIGQLEHDPKLAFVQTIKEAQVAPGDPFNNREAIFYRSQMLARNAANAVFPVWFGRGLAQGGGSSRSATSRPGTSSRDLQSGVEALRRGWRGLYLPIVGAVPQHSPPRRAELLQAARHPGASTPCA